VERIRRTGKAFADLDDLYGGGHAHCALAAYLTQDVAPLLRGTTGKARPSLFTAAAQLAYLLGWMAADSRRPGLAQRWYIQSVRLAEEASNPDMRSTALRSLAVQALELGHNAQGLELAEEAANGLRAGSPPRTRAWITGMCAEAVAASCYDKDRACKLLLKAEAFLDRADSGPEHLWTGNYRRESFQHQVGLTLSQMGDHVGAEEYYAASVGSRRAIERRTKALIGARLAHSQLRQRKPDTAARTVLNLSDDLTSLASSRVHHELTSLRRAWRPYRSNQTVAEADHLIVRLAPRQPAVSF
jgi:hypothetical protein